MIGVDIDSSSTVSKAANAIQCRWPESTAQTFDQFQTQASQTLTIPIAHRLLVASKGDALYQFAIRLRQVCQSVQERAGRSLEIDGPIHWLVKGYRLPRFREFIDILSKADGR